VAKGLSKDMPATKLSPAELQSVVAYVRSLSGSKSNK
jgi:mono/diheme cytochrome c family protein